MTSMELWASVARHTNDLRNLQGLISCEKFEEIFNANPEQVKSLVMQASSANSIRERYQALESLRLLMRNPDSLSFLKEEARQLGIKNYSRLDKETLKLEIGKLNGSYQANLSAG